MGKVMVEIDTNQIEKALEKLNEKERSRIINKIVTEEFEKVCGKFRKRIKEKRLTFDKINEIVTKARKEFYAESSGRY
jgi:phosphotransacetylase